MRKIAFILLFILSSINCHAATWYIDESGSDSANGQTESTPVLTFAFAFSLMSSGDTLIVLPGTYTSTNGSIDTVGAPSGQPTNGSLNGSTKIFTTIQARDGIGSVIIPQRLRLGTSVSKRSYVKISGIIFGGISGLYNTSWCYIKDCGFYANNRTNDAIISVGTNDHANGNSYNLLEDCFAVGAQRICGINYNSDHNVWRRWVFRGDGTNYSSGNPAVGFTIYSSQYVSAQNLMVLDKISDTGVDGQDFAGVQADPAGLFGNNDWYGCITINGEENGWMIEPASTMEDDSYTFRLRNCIAYNALYYGIGIQGSGAQHDVVINHCTAVGNGASGIRYAANTCTDPIIKNSLSEDNGAYGFYIACTGTLSEYNQAYNNTSGSFSPAGSNNTTQDSVMLYLLQAGAGGLTGDDALNRGAEVLKRYGTDGTFYGETDFDALSNVDLWPWPNEDVIKTQFSVDRNTSEETRGFCAAGTRLDGVSPITLTSYIWEILGNEIPEDIYGTPTYAAPTLSIDDTNTSSSSGTITGTYTIDDTLTGICTWSHSSGSVTGFATVLLGAVSGTVTGLPVGATTVSFILLDSEDQEATDTAIFTRTEAATNVSKGVTIQGVQWNQ